MNDVVLFYVLLFSIPVGLFIFRTVKRAEEKKSNQNYFNENNDGIYFHKASIAGKDYEIRIDENKRTVFLSDGNRSKEFSFSEIKSWRYEIPGETTVVIGGGTAGALATPGANYREARERFKDTGFFVMTRDIVDPEWKIAFYGEEGSKHSKKFYMSILKQFQSWMNVFDRVINHN
ncbi:DUF4755 domain-containing protein [Avibacterium avium]